MRKTNKTLQKKWFDFTHPTKIEHYGYHFSADDLRQFPEGRIVLCHIAKAKLQKKRNEKIDDLMFNMRNNYNNTMDKLVLDCMSVP